MREVVFDPGAFGPRAALLIDGRLWEFAETRDDDGEVTDRLYLARVVRVEPRLDAAFLDYGEGLGFLTAKDARFLGEDRGRLSIVRRLREGERLIVQGLREADGDKGPRFTTDIRLFGLYLIYRPRAQGIEISKRARRREREQLAARGRALFGTRPFLLRRFAAAADDRTLLAEAEHLEVRWRELQREAEGRSRPGPLAAAESPIEHLFRWAMEREPQRLLVTDPALRAALARLLDAVAGAVRPELLGSGGESAFAASGVDEMLEEALSPVVPLAGGGRLVIEPTLALTAVDVDGEGRDALSLDLEAAAELGRQLRLRNIGGNIIVDFVELRRPGDRKRLQQALEKAVRDDPLEVQIHPMSALGILHLTRAKRGRSLLDRFRRPCSCCAGSGREPSLEARAESLFRELRLRPHPAVSVALAPDLAGFLEGRGPPAWLRAARLQRDPSLAPGCYRIEEGG